MPAAPIPPELAAAIEAHGARVVGELRGKPQHPRRLYLELESPRGRLHALSSEDPADRRIVAHEVATRRAVGVEGPLRSPPILASGELWFLGAHVDADPVGPAEHARLVATAADRLAQLELPPGPLRGRDVSLAVIWSRRLRLLRSPLPTADVIAARRIMAGYDLPPVTAHGYFHPVHVVLAGGGAWLFDWELSGRLPAGWELMNYWSAVEDSETRDALFDAALDVVGRRHEPALRRLGYALLVRAISAKLTNDRDLEAAQALLRLLPATRAAASPRAPSPPRG